MADFFQNLGQLAFELAVVVAFLIVGAIIMVVMTSKEIKTWVKTLIYFLLSEGIALILGLFCRNVYLAGNISGAVVGFIVAGVLAIGFLAGGICGHRRQWQKTMN